MYMVKKVTSVFGLVEQSKWCWCRLNAWQLNNEQGQGFFNEKDGVKVSEELVTRVLST